MGQPFLHKIYSLSVELFIMNSGGDRIKQIPEEAKKEVSKQIENLDNASEEKITNARNKLENKTQKPRRELYKENT